MRTGGEGRARGGRDLGKSQVPGLERLPRHPLTPCIPPPLPQGAPHSPPLFTLRKHSSVLELSGSVEGSPCSRGTDCLRVSWHEVEPYIAALHNNHNEKLSLERSPRPLTRW